MYRVLLVVMNRQFALMNHKTNVSCVFECSKMKCSRQKSCVPERVSKKMVETTIPLPDQ